MARDPADARSLSTVLFDAAVDFLDHRGVSVNPKTLADLCDHLAAEVRPEAEEGVVTLDAKRWRFFRDAVLPGIGFSGYAVPVTDGDDQPDHRGEPQGDPPP